MSGREPDVGRYREATPTRWRGHGSGELVLNHTVITAEGVASICHGERVMIIILNGATGQIIRSGETVTGY